MDNLKDKTVCVYDHGAFFHVTQRLARDFGRTLFFKPWQKSNPVFMDMAAGDGFENIERVKNFFEVIPEVDLFVFPGLFDGDLQLHLESLGKRVWGSRRGERYEFMRSEFKSALKDVGLEVSDHERIRGLDRLVEFLKENENTFVKISRFRGDGETWHHVNYRLSESKLDAMRFYYGPFRNQIDFLVEYEIDSEIEAAYDGYCVDGEYPDLGIHGYEIKDRAYLATLQKYDEMPEQVREVNDLFSTKLAQVRYRSMWGTEIKIGKDGKNYFLDATCRTPAPPGEIECELFGNYSEILWHGSVGELVQIEPVAEFAASVAITSSASEYKYQALDMPPGTEQWVKLFSPSKVDGMTYVSPEQKHPLMDASDELGFVVGVGDTIQEAIDNAVKHCDSIQGMGVQMHPECLADAVEEIHTAQEAGMKFTDDPVPEPQSVI